MRNFNIKIALLVLFSFSLTITAKAQLYSDSGDPARLKWYSTQTPHYQIIYPQGLDSLAKVYGRLFEYYRPQEEWSSGLLPGQYLKKPMPIVLHSYNAYSNGFVAWGPRKVGLYTIPEATGDEALKWEKELAVHESRHISQFMMSRKGVFKPLGWLFGEVIGDMVIGVYPGMAMIEGDAVATETGLTNAGRGRSAEFLNFYMSAFDNGDMRDWYQWRYGSWRRYAPNYYALGYLTVAGQRVFNDDPSFMARYYKGVTDKPLQLFHRQKEMSAVSGKPFKETFKDIQLSFKEMWNEEAEARKPFINAELVEEVPSWYASYAAGGFRGDDLIAVKSGLIEPNFLVRIGTDGSEEKIRPFSTMHGYTVYDAAKDRIYWSEVIVDKRWTKDGTSRIRYIEGDSKKIHDLTKSGRLFNPDPSSDGSRIAAVEYPVEGGSSIVVFDSEGTKLKTLKAPDSLQVYQALWFGDYMIAGAKSFNGDGLYAVSTSGEFSLLEGPYPYAITKMRIQNGNLIFTSDRTGVNEIYSMSPSGEVSQLTSTRYGAADGVFKGDTLYFTSLNGDGNLVYRTSEAMKRVVNMGEYHRYAVADKLSEQEKAMATADALSSAYALSSANAGGAEVTFTAPKRYRKLPHLFNFHTWTPVYIDYDDLSDFTFSSSSLASLLGVTGFFQNRLGSAYGSLGVSFGKDKLDRNKMRPSFHFNMTYKGWYPAFDVEFNFNERNAVQYTRVVSASEDLQLESTEYSVTNKPHINGSVKMYVPLRFNSGGWNRGITPSVKYLFSNDRYNKSRVIYNYYNNLSGSAETYFSDYQEDYNLWLQVLTTSLSAYVIRNKAASQEFPSWGLGGEVGYHTRIAMSDIYSAGVYTYGYAYTPGLFKAQGLKLTALWQHRFDEGVLYGENSVSTIPRGFSGSRALLYLAYNSADQLRLTADYAIPIWIGDISTFSPLFYIKNFVLTPHVDYTFISTEKSLNDAALMSAGADFVANLGNLLWIPVDTRVGVTFDWKGGKSYSAINESYDLGRRFYWGVLFSVDF